MKLAHHYRILGLRRSASFQEVKRAYRHLVRKYHPDINPDKAAIDRFIKINAAYTALCEALQPEDSSDDNAGDLSADTQQPAASETGSAERLNLHELKLKLEKLGLGNFQQADQHSSATQDQTVQANNARQPNQSTRSEAADDGTKRHSPEAQSDGPTVQASPAISEQDLSLKQEAYAQLKDLLRQQKFPRAIALVEGLAHRMPSDPEVIQWQAIVYQRWGRQLISQGQFQKARLYLKKALQTDPNNPSLGNEVARDLGLLKHLQAAEATL